MYCIVTAVKDPYDTKDMRTTANNDVNFAMDAPPFDATVVARLRAKGAIIYAKSIAHELTAAPAILNRLFGRFHGVEGQLVAVDELAAGLRQLTSSHTRKRLVVDLRRHARFIEYLAGNG